MGIIGGGRAAARPGGGGGPRPGGAAGAARGGWLGLGGCLVTGGGGFLLGAPPGDEGAALTELDLNEWNKSSNAFNKKSNIKIGNIVSCHNSALTRCSG